MTLPCSSVAPTHHEQGEILRPVKFLELPFQFRTLGRSAASAALAEWLPVILGLLVLFVPTLYDLVRMIWIRDDEFHGVIILLVVIWLAWDRRAVLLSPPISTAPVAGIALLIVGLLVYVLGRSQSILIFQVASLIPVLAGTFLAMRGWPALRALWFMLLFSAYLVPLPAYLQESLTLPLSQSVAAITDHVLHAAGYPIAHQGVTLTVGQYQLRVAEACAGLSAMFSLSAIGLVYLYLKRYQSWLHNALILLCVLPIAFLANITRVITLVLVTYHFGDNVGQGFVHGFSGIALFVFALIAVLLLDAILLRLLKLRESPS
jgi:exosortase B